MACFARASVCQKRALNFDIFPLLLTHACSGTLTVIINGSHHTLAKRCAQDVIVSELSPREQLYRGCPWQILSMPQH